MFVLYVTVVLAVTFQLHDFIGLKGLTLRDNLILVTFHLMVGKKI
jgi:hypothetical protein